MTNLTCIYLLKLRFGCLHTLQSQLDPTLLHCMLQHATTEDGGLELYPNAGVANIGIMLFRSEAKVFAEVMAITTVLDDHWWSCGFAPILDWSSCRPENCYGF